MNNEVISLLSLRGVSLRTTKQSRKTLKKHWIAARNVKHFARNDKHCIFFNRLCRSLYLSFLALMLMFPSAQGATLTVPGIANATLNNQLITLAQSNASIPEQKTQMINLVNSLLTKLAPQIKALPEYDNPFVINCTIFFDTQIEKVNCDLEFDDTEKLLEHADPRDEILRANLHEMPNRSILVTRTYVDWSVGNYLFNRGKFYLKQPREEEEAAALSKTFTDTEETTETLPVTSSVTPDTKSCSESNTPSASASFSVTPNTESESPSDTPSESLDVSQTITPVQSSMPVANWSAATGIYEDATNQPNRYVINNDVVIDTFSNLQWEQAHSNTTMSWLNATYYCGNKTTGGHKGWRLPAVQELQSLVDYTISVYGDAPGINVTAFPNTPLNYFWSSTPLAGGTPQESWYIVFGKDACSASACGGCKDCYSGVVYTQKMLQHHSVSPNGYVRCVYGDNISSVTNNRYDISVSNMVKDLVTGLVWERYASSSMLWQSAVAYCTPRTTGTFTGWRLPTVKELLTLLNYDITFSNLIINQEIFAGEPAWIYWALTPVSGVSSNVWGVYFYEGNILNVDIVGYSFNVRCVCDSNCRPIPIANWNASTGIYADATNQTGRYKVEDGVVTDTFSNLQWEQGVSTNKIWEEANSYCTNQTTGGLTGWRLPTVLELSSLIDYKVNWNGPGINTTFFPDTPAGQFWSSIALAGSTTEAWWVSFGSQHGNAAGYYSYFGTHTPYYVRCIRGGNTTLASRYDTNTSGVVKDKLTDLWWEKSSDTSIWNNLQSYCNDKTTGGINTWRPPTIKELLTVVDYKVPPGSLTMDTAFSGEPVNWYWSSSAVSDDSGLDWGWGIYFGNGRDTGDGMSRMYGVRCVVLGSDNIPTANWKASTGIYEDATNQIDRYKVENGIVIDTFSDLQWEQAHSTTTMPWSDADSYCANRNTGGHKGWRLPTVLELHTLVDYKIDYNGPGINTAFFPGTPAATFWSSTPLASDPNQAWWVSFGTQNGNWGGDNKYTTISTPYYVRCIRGSNNTIIDRYDGSSLSGVVKDKLTSLWWEKSDSGTSNWNELQSYCGNIHTGGLTWRPPTIKELLTVVDYKVPPGSFTMDAVFSGTAEGYRSSSAVSGVSGDAWLVYFQLGDVGSSLGMGHSDYVRCVCSGSDCFPIPIANWNASTGVYEDATNQTGRYKVDDGVVTDTFSNLQWEQANSTNTYNWTYANNTYCQSQNTGGYTGWRLPTALELQTLVDYTIPYQGDIAGINNTAFPNTPLSSFWSSTPMVGGSPEQSWYVSFGKDTCYKGVRGGSYDCYSGLVYSQKWLQNHAVLPNGYVRCVRGGNSTITNRYDDTSLSGVVKDRLTGLWWEQSSGNTITWSNLQSYCSGKSTGGITSWRPPTVKEFSTLVDYTKPKGSLTMDAVFSGTAGWYWSSSAVSGTSGDAWHVDFYYGFVDCHDMGSFDVRCVFSP